MYSIFAADVPDPADPTTSLNTALVNKLQLADEIIWAGEALSHCMLWSGTDLVNEMGDEHAKKILMFEDATSPVVSPDPAATQFFADNSAKFIKEMKAKGMRFAKTTDY
jgi:nicotinamidase-related amidase